MRSGSHYASPSLQFGNYAKDPFFGARLHSLFRRARGYSLRLGNIKRAALVVGTGGFLKNAMAWAENETLFLSPHVGDLDHSKTVRNWIGKIRALPVSSASIFTTDPYPGYPCVRMADSAFPEIKIKWSYLQHHKAHVLSGMFDQSIAPPLLAVAWDGTGLGDDGSLWGGEFFDVSQKNWNRVATFRPFPLFGGESAIRDPRRVSLALLWECDRELPPDRFGFSQNEISALRVMYEKRLESPNCSSVGRLFDGVAALTGVSLTNTYEGQAAFVVEAKSEQWIGPPLPFPFEFSEGVIDWRFMVNGIQESLADRTSPAEICHRFHVTLAEIILNLAQRTGRSSVLLTGGCFQNGLLCRLAIRRLREHGFGPYWHEAVPPNDGGLSIGQVIGALEDLCV